MRFENLIADYEKIKFKIRRTEIKEQEIRALEGFAASSGMEGMPKTKSNSSSVENSVVRLTQILEERKQLEIDLENIRKQISSAIDLVSSLIAQEIIETKIFIQNCGWKYISKKMSLSIRRVMQLYNEGVEEINKRLGDSSEI